MELTGGDTERAASLRSKVTTSTLNRQLAKNELSADTVIKLCRGYGASPVAGLAATGHITEEEATGVPLDAISELLSDQELIRTLAYRVNMDPAAWFGTFGELAQDTEDSQGRSNTHLSVVDGVPYGAVADSSPDEDALREAEEGDVD